MPAYTYSENNINYTNIKKPTINTGFKIGVSDYNVDDEGNLNERSNPIINAIDIDWNGAQIGDNLINTTSDLLNLIGSGGSGNIDINNDTIKIMINAIRALQAEVVKLRNSFKYGITSMIDTDTAMSNVLHDYIDVTIDEPLWATDESELSEIEGLSFGDPRQFEFGGDTVINGENDNAYVKISGVSYWEDKENRLIDINDPKIYCYMTTDHLNIIVNLNSVNYTNDGNIDTTNINEFTIDFSKLNIRESINGKYNILIVIGRKQLYKNSLYSENFIWLCIADYLTSNTIFSGYIDDSNIDNIISSSSPIYIDNRYIISKIIFNNLELSKLDFYSKYNDFTNNVQESTPSDEDYKYDAAHITIRSVKTRKTLDNIKDQLLDDELIYCKENGRLYIISDNTIKNIGAGSSESDEPAEEDTMTNEELLEKLVELGIITIETSESGEVTSTIINNDIILNPFEAIRFINTETNKTFNITVDSHGNFVSTEEQPQKTLEYTIGQKNENLISSLLKCEDRDFFTSSGHTDAQGMIDVRGFVSRYNDLLKNGSLSGITSEDTNSLTGSWKLNADRVKIGAVYAPLSTDTKISCTHAYIELENTMNKDFPLDGCYLHFDRPVMNSNGEIDFVVSHLALKGFIPANSTYLIRGKKYRDSSNSDVYISVDTYDQEWLDKEIDNELIDFTLLQDANDKAYSFALTYHFEDLSHNDVLSTANAGTLSKKTFSKVFGVTSSDFPFLYVWNFIDAICINNQNGWIPAGAKGGKFVMKPNSLYKNTFELDPAKQAYNSLNKKDSSRSRYQNTETDNQTVELSEGYITFPKTKEFKKYVKDYTPKASFECKNVQTDKTKLNYDKPNAVTVSFGTNVFTTRCFNWLSAGLHNEYVFLKKPNGTWCKPIESYKRITTENALSSTYPRRKEYPVNINNVVYASLTKDRIYDYFPADNTYYTSHKCIIEIVETPVSEPETWTYVIGRLGDDGISPDPNYCSDEMHFTLYPSSYKPRIYQTTDQQGFHWVEYQAWAACAKKINEVIHNECDGQEIMPILINTGDMTQSGARVSEWLDYYNAGISLFDHLEQMNIVGNNDLMPSISVNEIGTGDDADKSNAYFYSLFYCYEVNPIYLSADTNHENPIYPIINNVYIPSLYYIDINNLRLLFLNSEITEETCKTWFKTVLNDTICNVYTGYPTTQANTSNAVSPYLADELGFTTIYTMIYHMTEDTSKKYVAICHEMPFTVITRDSLFYENSGKTEIESYRSISAAKALVGCHMNQISKGDFGNGIYWFSRLLEYRHIKLCLGGHKHTYCCTYPVAENYKYGNGKYSLIDGPMSMGETLNTELERSIIWQWKNENASTEMPEGKFLVNHTKLPFALLSDDEISIRYANNANEDFTIKRTTTGKNEPIFLPVHVVSNSWANSHPSMSFVTYFMCQATGYKLTSNKELPTPLQRFSMLIPKTNDSGASDSADTNQQSPMYATIDFANDFSTYSIKLARIRNVGNDNATGAPKKWSFTQQSYSKNAIRLEYMALANEISDTYNYGKWNETAANLITNNIL